MVPSNDNDSQIIEKQIQDNPNASAQNQSNGEILEEYPIGTPRLNVPSLTYETKQGIHHRQPIPVVQNAMATKIKRNSGLLNLEPDNKIARLMSPFNLLQDVATDDIFEKKIEIYHFNTMTYGDTTINELFEYQNKLLSESSESDKILIHAINATKEEKKLLMKLLHLEDIYFLLSDSLQSKDYTVTIDENQVKISYYEITVLVIAYSGS
jgi:hypothetical protein